MLTPKDMKAYLAKAFSMKNLKKELHNSNSEFYFAESEKEIAGYLKINFGEAQTEIRDEKGMEIERIYVLKEYQGQRVGQKLFDKALNIAREKKLHYLWLGVWEKNLRE